ncbi:hypothetical protein BS47DRAFT_1299875 [Hydnum rufescens UP504]|uniref:Uncharacterized protein n=1 Tax=Hydnum rufescens UP504 TaxID=1448309 RepID=A0A9P6DR54_9AGAM|nr:hypothetical protein BS47DRAFT_1299875 [Hydnum rufescens UP504]
MVSAVANYAPELFKLEIKTRKKQFTCSHSFIHWFMCGHLQLSCHQGTCAAQKIPKDAQEQGLDMFFCLCSFIHDHSTPLELILNFNQTQGVYSPGTQYTWHTQGKKQVPIISNEDKCVFSHVMLVFNMSSSSE